MTQVIDLYGGPGTGKSTSAALLYAFLKMGGVNTELVREYVKEWAWEGRVPGEFDQIYLLGKGVRKESLLYGKVDWVVSDSPVLLGVYYARQYGSKLIAEAVETAAIKFYDNCKNTGVVHHHIVLERTKKFNPLGRFQTETEAKKIDVELIKILEEFKIPYVTCGTSPANLMMMLFSLGVHEEVLDEVDSQFDGF
jgi:hypothetical protein